MTEVSSDSKIEPSGQSKMMRSGCRGALGCVVLVLGLFFVAGLIGAVTPAGPNTEAVKRAIEAQNYKDAAEIEQHYWGSHYIYGCGSDDSLAYTATATNTNGERVQLVVCTDLLFKAYTIRVRK